MKSFIESRSSGHSDSSATAIDGALDGKERAILYFLFKFLFLVYSLFMAVPYRLMKN